MKKRILLLLCLAITVVYAQDYRWHLPMVTDMENGTARMTGITAEPTGRVAMGGQVKASLTIGSLSLTNNGGPGDGYLIVIDPNSTVLWHKQFFGDNVTCSTPAFGVNGTISVLVIHGDGSYSFNGGNAGTLTRSDRFAIHTFDVNGNWLRATTIQYPSEMDLNGDNGSTIRLVSGPDGEVLITGTYHGGVLTINGPSASLTVPPPTGQTTPYPFVLKLHANGNPAWMHNYDRSLGISIQECAVADDGHIYLVGNVTLSQFTDFDPSPAVVRPHVGYGQDGYLMKFTPAGDFSWVKLLDANSSFVNVRGISHHDGHLRLVGDHTGTVDFDPGPNVHSKSTLEDNDAFILSLTTAGDFEWVRTCTGHRYQYGLNVDHTSNGDIVFACVYRDTLRYEGLPPAYSATGHDVALLRINSAGALQWLAKFPFDWLGIYSRSYFVTGGSDRIYGIPVINEAGDLDPGPGQQPVNPQSNSTVRALVQFGDQTIIGCMDPASSNYAPTALVDNGLCIRPGCTDPRAFNFNANANWDDGSCQLPSATCIADLNGDGIVNVMDFGIFISFYGTVCPP